ncbi:ABC transporter ATP-binding protein [Dethiothermospora halolimnae]|uniref:ABC transporter ATP-binding protein n=1 Tax=Dethiothermospora halolimnae TaxID=3114390 RepID=UPI003CCB9BFF
MGIKIKGLSKIYKEGDNVVNALKDVNISIDENEFVMIIGPSGGGKTTLLNMMGLLDTPSEGKIYIDDIDITGLKGEERTIYRRENIGFIFQEFNLIETLSVYENIILTRSLSGKATEKTYVKEVTEKLGIYDKLDSFPSKLSGGQRQRVAIARSIITKPKIILADEPTGNLDTHTSDSVMKILKKAVDEFNQTVIMVTHDLELVRYARKVINIVDGKAKYKNK